MLGQGVVSLDEPAGTATTDRSHVPCWDALVLATGARPRRLPFPAPPGVHVLRTVADAAALRADLAGNPRLVIVGGGFVGAEVASTARAFGVEVTMLEAAQTPFGRLLGGELGNLLAERYRAHGVDLLTRTSAAAFRAGDNGEPRPPTRRARPRAEAPKRPARARRGG